MHIWVKRGNNDYLCDMVFIFESLIACALFTLFVFLMSRDPIKTIFNYPPAIIERCDKLGLVDAGNKPGGAGRRGDCHSLGRMTFLR